MNKYPSVMTITVFAFCCITMGVLIMYFAEKYDNRFSPPRVPVPAAVAGPGHIMRVTAYCPCSLCCGKWSDGYTASGHKIQPGDLIVAAPSDTKFGTVLDIPGYGRATVQDRGGAITGNRLDVLFATHEEAKQWGVQYLMVKEVRQ